MQPQIFQEAHDDSRHRTLQFCADNNAGFGVADKRWRRGIEFEDNSTQKVVCGLLFGVGLAFLALKNQFVFGAFVDSKRTY
jgi:hypothetical protein